jgi:hypothetical protein
MSKSVDEVLTKLNLLPFSDWERFAKDFQDFKVCAFPLRALLTGCTLTGCHRPQDGEKSEDDMQNFLSQVSSLLGDNEEWLESLRALHDQLTVDQLYKVERNVPQPIACSSAYSRLSCNSLCCAVGKARRAYTEQKEKDGMWSLPSERRG